VCTWLPALEAHCLESWMQKSSRVHSTATRDKATFFLRQTSRSLIHDLFLWRCTVFNGMDIVDGTRFGAKWEAQSSWPR